jgi:hypothetical protein
MSAKKVDFCRTLASSAPSPTRSVPAAADAIARPVAVRQAEDNGIRVKVPIEDWLKYTRFSSLDQRQTLNHVICNVQRAMSAFYRHGGPRPLVVFDLDDTLFRVSQPRTFAVVKDWLAQQAATIPPDIGAKIGALSMGAYGYGPESIFERAGCHVADPAVAPSFAAFMTFWKARFFSNEYLKYDLPEQGAVAFVNAIADLGANVAYLTGRDKTNMEQGSLDALADKGFPMPSDRVRLILKADPKMPDDVFKHLARKELAQFGRVIATFDNSPSNIVALRDNYPHATNVFVQTLFDKAPVELRSGLYKVSSFARS